MAAQLSPRHLLLVLTMPAVSLVAAAVVAVLVGQQVLTVNVQVAVALALLAWVLAAVARALVKRELAHGFGEITPSILILEHLRRVTRQIPAHFMFLAARVAVLVRRAAMAVALHIAGILCSLVPERVARLVIAQAAIQISLGFRQALGMGRSIDRRSHKTSHILQPA